MPLIGKSCAVSRWKADSFRENTWAQLGLGMCISGGKASHAWSGRMASNDDKKGVPRRDFLNVAVGGSAAAFVAAGTYPVVRYLEPPPGRGQGAVRVGKLEEFPVGSVRTVLVGERPVLIIRTADEVRAFSAICSHLQCVVAYSSERKRIECPCHGGVYSTDGRNIEGPPPRPLDELLVTIDEGAVLVSAAG